MRFLRCLIMLMISVPMFLPVAGCSGSGSGPGLLSISIYPNAPNLVAGSTLQLYATALYSNGNTSDVTSSVQWSSLATNIATITSPGGLATAGATAGTTVITASMKGISGTTTLTVAQSGAFGTYSSWSTTGSPSGVAVASFNNFSGTAPSGSNNVYVTDATNNMLRVFNPVGTQIASWSTTGEPHGVAINQNNNLYVIDITNSLVRKFNASGTQIKSWATTGSPSGIAVDVSTSNVYVTDSLNKQVFKYYSSGTQALSWQTNWVPYGIASDAHGNVYVTDITNKQVHFYDPNGNETAVPLTIAGFAYGIAVTPSGSFEFVTDYPDKLTLQYGSSGSPTTLSSGFVPYGVAVDAAGNVYITDLSKNLLHRY